ncbi:MAG: glycosyl transferase family 2 [Methanophagales archaeon ANME-1-THS]|nr:MAG: glycosyl transferase family 2 [Methanophagales archaeon ANME-1-THS]
MLKPVVLEKIEQIKPVDIVVGISARNVDTTIVHVMNVAATGLLEFLPDYKGLVVVSNGFSTDRTTELAELFELPRKVAKIVTEEVGELGKGSAIRTILEIAKHAEAATVILLDGDLLSVRPQWIEHLGQPPIYGTADLIVPYYVRYKYDGIITNNLAYPLTRALYGVHLRQPIGGDYGLSAEFSTRLLDHPLFPYHFGIDIFMTTVAAAEDAGIQEVLLGLKLHESTTKYIDPGTHLTPMFREVVGTMLDLMMHYEEVWKNETVYRKISRVKARYHGQKPTPITVDIGKVDKMFKEGYRDFKQIISASIAEDLFKELETAAQKEPAEIPPELWAKIVYHMAAAYKRNGEKRTLILDALRILWLGRFTSYVNDTRDMGTEEAEREIERQARIFEQERDYLLAIY